MDQLRAAAPHTAALVASSVRQDGTLDMGTVDHTVLYTHLVQLCKAVTTAGPAKARHVGHKPTITPAAAVQVKNVTCIKPNILKHKHAELTAVEMARTYLPRVEGDHVTVAVSTQHLACFHAFDESAGAAPACMAVTMAVEAGAAVRSVGYSSPTVELTLRSVTVDLDDSGRLFQVTRTGGREVWVLRLAENSPARKLPVQPSYKDFEQSRTRRSVLAAHVDTVDVQWTREPLATGTTTVLANGDGVLVKASDDQLHWYMLNIPQEPGAADAHPMDAAGAHPVPAVKAALEDAATDAKAHTASGKRARSDVEARAEAMLTDALPAHIQRVLAAVGRHVKVQEQAQVRPRTKFVSKAAAPLHVAVDTTWNDDQPITTLDGGCSADDSDGTGLSSLVAAAEQVERAAKRRRRPPTCERPEFFSPTMDTTVPPPFTAMQQLALADRAAPSPSAPSLPPVAAVMYPSYMYLPVQHQQALHPWMHNWFAQPFMSTVYH